MCQNVDLQRVKRYNIIEQRKYTDANYRNIFHISQGQSLVKHKL